MKLSLFIMIALSFSQTVCLAGDDINAIGTKYSPEAAKTKASLIWYGARASHIDHILIYQVNPPKAVSGDRLIF